MNIKLNKFKINAPQAKIRTDFKIISRNFKPPSGSATLFSNGAIGKGGNATKGDL